MENGLIAYEARKADLGWSQQTRDSDEQAPSRAGQTRSQSGSKTTPPRWRSISCSTTSFVIIGLFGRVPLWRRACPIGYGRRTT